MAENKTQKTDASVKDFIETVDDERKKQDSFKLVELMEKVSGDKAAMWGTAIIGCGDMQYQGKSCGGDYFKIGFSPRKAALSLYIMAPAAKKDPIIERMGKVKKAGSCIHIKRLDDVDIPVLEELLKAGMDAPDSVVYN